MADQKRKGDALYDYLILGAGPAGLQLGYFFEREGRDYLILEAADSAGTFFQRFPRHRTLISINKLHTGYDDHETNLRWDWNSLLSHRPEMLFRNYSREYFPHADDMVRYLRGFAACFDLRIRYGFQVRRVSREHGLFHVAAEGGETLTCRRLIVATGLFKPYLPAIEGIELTEGYDQVSVDPEDFVNQRVLILGKGNSGFETADNLIPRAALIHVASPRPINLAWKTHFVGHLRARNNNFLDTYQLKSQNAVLDASIERIRRRGEQRVVSVRYSHAGGEIEDLVYDRVIACTGFRFDAGIFDDTCRPALTHGDRLPDQTPEWESANVPGLYFAGALMQARDYKKYTSAFIHGFRYNVRALHRLLAGKHHGIGWPAEEIAVDPDSLVREVIGRVNRTSAMWQQFSVLGDLIVPDRENGWGKVYRELPLDYIPGCDLVGGGDYYTVNMEFGSVQEDPFNIQRSPVPERAAESSFLHPVVRHCRGGEVLAEHHLLENLFGEWKSTSLHLDPLRSFFERGRRAA